MGEGISGTTGADKIVATADGSSQIHIFANAGNDDISLDFASLIDDSNDDRVVNGHHAYGGAGADRFHFTNVGHLIDQDLLMVGRIDDFDVSQDSIWIDGTRIDPRAPPAQVQLADGTVTSVRIVDYVIPNPTGQTALSAQQFLLIGENILYALEGARLDLTSPTDEEAHFFLPKGNVGALPSTTFVDPVNYVPAYAYASLRIDQEYIVGRDSLTGSAGNDFIYFNKLGSGNGNRIEAGAGDDVINAGQGRDAVFGGLGNDLIAGGLDDDRLYGDAGNDILWGGSEADWLYGGAGRDQLLGGEHNDRLFGGDHSDILRGEHGADQLFGGNGNDLLQGGQGADRLLGEGGDDTLEGGDLADRLYGGAGNDLLYAGTNYSYTVDGLFGEAGDDTLFGNAGFDHLDGGAGNDVLDGGHQADNLYGRDGNDTLRGDLGLDRLFGGAGDDFGRGGEGEDGLFGDTGNDTLYGEAGNDRIYGGPGDDFLSGGAGDDFIRAGAGFDTIIGGAGNDVLEGNFNADVFVFANGHGHDMIRDFEARNSVEKIDVSAVSGITGFADLIANHATQQGANVRIDTGSDSSITLAGVSLSDLDADDFLF